MTVTHWICDIVSKNVFRCINLKIIYSQLSSSFKEMMMTKMIYYEDFISTLLTDCNSSNRCYSIESWTILRYFFVSIKYVNLSASGCHSYCPSVRSIIQKCATSSFLPTNIVFFCVTIMPQIIYHLLILCYEN